MTEDGRPPGQSPEAFIAALYAAFGESVRAKLRGVGVDNGDDVEDLSQTVFLVALRSERRLPRDLKAAGLWLVAAARKIAANYQRLFRRTYEVQNNDAIDGAIAEPVDPEAALTLRILVHESAQRLDITEREILERYHFDGDRLVDLAKWLGLTKSGAHMRLRHIEARLAAIIEKKA